MQAEYCLKSVFRQTSQTEISITDSFWQYQIPAVFSELKFRYSGTGITRVDHDFATQKSRLLSKIEVCVTKNTICLSQIAIPTRLWGWSRKWTFINYRIYQLPSTMSISKAVTAPVARVVIRMEVWQMEPRVRSEVLDAESEGLSQCDRIPRQSWLPITLTETFTFRTRILCEFL